MPRPLKFPGLQTKFENALIKILANEALSSGDIYAALQAGAQEFDLASGELEDLKKNFANYIARAKDSTLIRSGGSWTGYQLVRPQQTVPLLPQGGSVGSQERQVRRPSEGAMHLVATFGMSLQFGSRVMSLPTSVDTITWGNADMLMLRGNPSRRRLEDAELDSEFLRLADSSPECILTSIELKYGLERNRRLWFQAVAEAAANSRWANESMLVHVSSDNQGGPIDEEVLSLARSAEIGILELGVAASGTRRVLDTRILLAAPQRPFLRLNELHGSRVGLLKEAHALLRSWNTDVVTFLDEDGPEAKLLRLLRQALENLRRQAGFLPQQHLKDALAPFASERRISELYAAALDTAATGTSPIATDFEAATVRLSTVMGELSKNEYDAFNRDLGCLKEFALSARSEVG